MKQYCGCIETVIEGVPKKNRPTVTMWVDEVGYRQIYKGSVLVLSTHNWEEWETAVREEIAQARKIAEGYEQFLGCKATVEISGAIAHIG